MSSTTTKRVRAEEEEQTDEVSQQQEAVLTPSLPVVAAQEPPPSVAPPTVQASAAPTAITCQELQKIAIANGCQSANVARLFLCAAFPTPSDRALALLVYQVAMQCVKAEFRVRIQKRDLVPLVLFAQTVHQKIK